MNLQRPTEPGWLHETHEPPQATLQHTPSAEKPEVHSLFSEDFAPFSLSPQLRFTHCWPAAHWALVVHS